MSRGLDQDALAAAGDGTYGSIRDMLVHVVSAQELFLSGMTGTPSASDIAVGMEFPGLPVLRAHTQAADEALIALSECRAPGGVLTDEFGGRAYRCGLSLR